MAANRAHGALLHVGIGAGIIANEIRSNATAKISAGSARQGLYSRESIRESAAGRTLAGIQGSTMTVR